MMKRYRCTQSIIPRRPTEHQAMLARDWNKYNLQRIAELDAQIARSSGIVVLSHYERAV